MRRVAATPAVVAAAVAAGVAMLAGCSNTSAPIVAPGGGGQTGIVVHGEGKVTGNPDTVTLVLGVQTQGPSARAALDANNARANAVITVLKGKGVRPEDLRTSQLSVSPTYGGPTNRITGYEVSNLVTATVHDIAAAGGIIDAAADAAGDAVRVQSLSFSIADDSDLRAQARAAAVRQAKEKAEQMADAAGVSLGSLVSMAEGTASPPPGPYAQMSPKAASAVPIEPGSQELTVTVDVVYAVG
jgi:uncharacterized protein